MIAFVLERNWTRNKYVQKILLPFSVSKITLICGERKKKRPKFWECSVKICRFRRHIEINATTIQRSQSVHTSRTSTEFHVLHRVCGSKGWYSFSHYSVAIKPGDPRPTIGTRASRPLNNLRRTWNWNWASNLISSQPIDDTCCWMHIAVKWLQPKDKISISRHSNNSEKDPM